MPVHAVHVSSVVNHLQDELDSKEPYVPVRFMGNSPHTEFEGGVEACVSFLKACYKRHKDATSRKERPVKQFVQHYLPVCKLHSALIRDAGFVNDVLKGLTAEEAKYVLTALIDYRQYCDTDHSSVKSSHSMYLLQDAADLTHIEEKIFGEAEVGGLKKDTIKEYRLPLALVAFGGIEEMLSLVVENGINLLQADEAGNTIIHHLVDISEEQPGRAVTMYEHIIEQVQDSGTKKILIMQVNKEGQTPLDVASERCLPEMMHALFNTYGVYKFQLRDCGTYVHNVYDLTHDEKVKRLKGCTVLHYMSVVTEEQLARLDRFGLLDKEPFTSWIADKFEANKNMTRAWMVLWAVLVSLYLTSIFWKEQFSSKYHIAVVVIAASLLVQEVVAVYTTYPYYKVVVSRVRRGIKPVVFASGYRLFQVFFIITALVTHALPLGPLDCNNQYLKFALLTLQTETVLNAFMGLMFFTQLNKNMGHYLNVVEKMMTSTASFLGLGFFFFIGFAASFFILYQPSYCTKSSIVGNATDPLMNDTGNFATFWRSIYETFLLILAVSAPKDWYFKASRNSLLTVWVYVWCLVFNTLVLLNLLIAIMNQRVVEICRHKRCINIIQQLSIYLFVEDKTLMQRKCLRLLRSRSLDRGHRYMLPSRDGSKMYLHTMESSQKPTG